MYFNLPTAIVFGIVVLVFVILVFNEIRKKKQGKGSCSCGCSSCNLCDKCHTQKNEQE